MLQAYPAGQISSPGFMPAAPPCFTFVSAPEPGQNRAAWRTQNSSCFFCDRPFNIIKCISEAHHGFGIAGDIQIAREESGVTIPFGVHQFQQQHEPAPDPGFSMGRAITWDSPECEGFWIGAQMKCERQFDRIDQEGTLFVRPEPREDRRVSVANPPDNM